MRAAISTMEVVVPRSVADAVKRLGEAARAGEPLVPLAGCTDVLVALNFGTLPGRRYLDLWKLEDLRRIEEKRGLLSIGALATYTDLIRSRLVARWLPMLSQAAREIGGTQIQNRGTIGGNVANGSPAGDTLPVLLAAGATVVLRGTDGMRRVPFGEFYSGYRRSVRRDDELIVALEIPPVEGTQFFRKVGTRAANAISKVVMAAVKPPRGAPRIALGSVAPTVIRVPRAEAALAQGASIVEAQRVLENEIQPIDDLRSTADYRRKVAAHLLAQFWAS